jgi:hypothetical protein
MLSRGKQGQGNCMHDFQLNNGPVVNGDRLYQAAEARLFQLKTATSSTKISSINSLVSDFILVLGLMLVPD